MSTARRLAGHGILDLHLASSVLFLAACFSCLLLPGAAAGDGAVLVASGHGQPWLNLQDATALATADGGALALVKALGSDLTRPISLAAADLDEDGVPDLVVGHTVTRAGSPSTGLVVVRRGNVDAVWPDTPGARARRAAGTAVSAPFAAAVHVAEILVAPELLGAGDFDADGHLDLVATTRGDTALTWLPGDGAGTFGAPRTVALPGRVTALAVGDVNRRDGLEDVVVGVALAGSGAVVVFEGPGGALLAEPEVLALAAPVAGVAIGQLDEHFAVDLAAVAGRELVVVHGRDRRLSEDSRSRTAVAPAAVEAYALAGAAAALAVGDFVPTSRYRLEVAVLLEDGVLTVLDPSSGQWGARRDAVAVGAGHLVRANTSSRRGDDMLVVDPVGRRIHVVAVAAEEGAAAGEDGAALWAASLETSGPAVAVLPMRLNVDGLDDLVILADGAGGPAVSLTAPTNTYVVNSTNRELYDECKKGDGVCAASAWRYPPNAPRWCEVLTGCNLRIAEEEANAGPGMDTISIGVGSLAGESPLFTAPVTLLGNGAQLQACTLSLMPGSDGSVVRGFTIKGNVGDSPVGLWLGSNGGIVEGNTFGPMGPHGDVWIEPVRVEGAHTTVGGRTPEARNTFMASGGEFVGVELNGPATGNMVEGNVFGSPGAAAGATGAAAGPPYPSLTDAAVFLFEGATGNTVGGTAAGARNIIAGTPWAGVAISASNGNLVQGNYIGVDSTGLKAARNAGSAVIVFDGSSDNTIGGTSPAARNVIAGNQGVGVFVHGDEDFTTRHNLVQGNYIGTDATGLKAVPNSNDGVSIWGTAPDTVIGGASSGARNVISGNTKRGVAVAEPGSTGTVVQGNLIGVGKDGRTPLGNGSNGVEVASGQTLVGGVGQGLGNTIANSSGDGVSVRGVTGVSILGNSIWANTDLGIDLGSDGWTKNGTTGGSGSNNWQRFPVLADVTVEGAETVVRGTMAGTAGTTYRVELFGPDRCGARGLMQGRYFLTSTDVAVGAGGEGTFSFRFPDAVGYLTATATRLDAGGQPTDTSELSPVDLQVTGTEVVQVIQDLGNHVPLIEDRPTTVRVYLQAVGCDSEEVAAKLSGPLGEITTVAVGMDVGVDDGTERPSTQERADARRSLAFPLPLEWARGPVDWTLELNPGCTLPDAACGEANRVEIEGRAFEPGGTIAPYLVPIRWVRGGADVTPAEGKYTPFMAAFWLYPIAMNPLRYWIGEPLQYAGDLTTTKGWDGLLTRMWMRYAVMADQAPGTRYYGVVDAAVPYGPEGVAWLPGGALGMEHYAAGRADRNHGQWLLIHEVGHTYGRLHAGCRGSEARVDPGWPSTYGRCSIGDRSPGGHFGFDGTSVKDPVDHADFMSYAFLPGSPRRQMWSSEHTFRGLHEAIAAAMTRAWVVTPASPEAYLAVRGAVALSGGASSLDTIYAMTGPGGLAEPGSGAYAVEARDASGQVLASHAFDLANPHLGAGAAEAGFAALLPHPAGTARVVLTRGGNELASRAASAHVPEVTLLAPTGGQALDGTVGVRWDVSDADGEALRTVVQVSRDGGASWEALAMDLEGTSHDLDTTTLPGGAMLLRVLVSDGLNTGVAVTASPVTVGRMAPGAVILSPGANATVAEGRLVLWGAGTDPEDGPIGNAGLSWSDSVVGALGTGARIERAEGLPAGKHTITLTATDADAATGRDSVTIWVGDGAAAGRVLLPSVAHAPGLAGTQWRTDVVAVNPGTATAALTLDFVSHDGARSLSGSADLAPGATVEWRDILVSRLGLPADGSSKGTLAVVSSVPIELSSRTYNQATVGTYGQHYPALELGAALPAGTVGIVPQLAKSEELRTNLGVVNLGEAPVEVLLSIFGADSTQLGRTASLTVPGGRWSQANDIFATCGAPEADIAYATVEVVTGGGRVWAYASVVDNVTGDPTTVPVQVGATRGPYLVPSVAHTLGTAGTRWRSDVTVVNPGALPAALTLTYHDTAGSSPMIAKATLPAGGTVIWHDILVELLGLNSDASSKGTLTVDAAVPLVVSSRTYNQSATGTYGQHYPALTVADALPLGHPGIVPQLAKGETVRTNLAVVNLGPAAASVAVTLRDGSGAQVGGTVTLTVPAGRWLQQDDILRSAGAGEQALAYAVVEPTSAGARVWACASVIDATTGDPTTIPVLPR